MNRNVQQGFGKCFKNLKFGYLKRCQSDEKVNLNKGGVYNLVHENEGENVGGAAGESSAGLKR
ncbi:hypothetical protein D3C71_1603540 [compost metagenome]